MTARLARGQLISVNGHNAIVITVGRSACYSAVVLHQGAERPRILTEVPFWIDKGDIKPGDVAPTNVVWAKDYAASHLLPEVS